MKGRMPLALVLATLCIAPVVHAQARGPSAQDVLENGQDILTRREQQELAAEEVREQAEKEEQALRDPAVRAELFAELDAWFRRMPGRYRIEGRIEKPEFRAGASTTVSGKVTGVADCSGIGEGVGVHCILNATWPIIETAVTGFGGPGRKADPLPASDMLRTFNPAVLAMGLNLDPPGIRAQMVNADSLSHVWVGKLVGDDAKANRVNRALQSRYINPLEVIAAPDSDVVTIILRSGLLALTLTMLRDEGATAEVPIKPLPFK
jgi:hypothetical protein